jgi:hypothetical protein
MTEHRVAPFQGALSNDEGPLARLLKHVTFPGPTPESEEEAREEARIFRAIARKEPGRPRGREEECLTLAKECLGEAERDGRRARKLYLARAGKKFGVTAETAGNQWREAVKKIHAGQ